MLQATISKTFVCLVLLALVSSSPVEQDSLLRLEWEAWKSTHSKTYSHVKEDLERSMVWRENKEMIESHNAKVEFSGYTLAMNEFGDMVNDMV